MAPARWKHFREIRGREFEGIGCDPMSRVYFRQEVLSKYEGVSGFEVLDDGSLSHRSYWGLVRSTERLGNEMVSSAIVDFAEEVPFTEWLHWQQYVVDPPSLEARQSIREEKSIPDAVNSLLKDLEDFSNASSHLVAKLGIQVTERIWKGSDEGLAARQLKWLYPANADDDEFLKRATLLSTLIVDELSSKAMRRTLQAWDENLHFRNAESRQSLGSRRLLERLMLVVAVIEEVNPTQAEVPLLIRQAEKPDQGCLTCDTHIEEELRRLHASVREDMAPLAFL